MPKFPDPFALSWGPWPPVAVEASHARRTLRVRLDLLRDRRSASRRVLARAEKLVRLAAEIEAGCYRDLCQLLDDADRLVDFEREKAGLEPLPDPAEPNQIDRMIAAALSGERLSVTEYLEQATERAIAEADSEVCEASAREIDAIDGGAGAPEIDAAAELGSGSGSRSCGWNNSPGADAPDPEGPAGEDQSGHNSTPGCAVGDGAGSLASASRRVLA